jgi:2-polyprenyl-3-methyl-5-hydroxy-6-metoxy-1,4-benzoquinol methylase
VNPAAIASLSQGASTPRVIAWAAREIAARQARIAQLVDAGCGRGDLARALAGRADCTIGLDAVDYGGAAASAGLEFHAVDLNRVPFPVAEACADVAAAVETIEHLENPRALMRELARMTRPDGLVVVTTPNQVSWLSKLSLVCKHEFTAFQEAPGLYPTHITALLPSDLRHIAEECGLERIEILYSGEGRLPGSARHYPQGLSRRWPRALSDNVMLLARKAGG